MKEAEAAASPPKRSPRAPQIVAMTPPYNFTILRGNGSELINKALQRRSWWRETPEGASFHFFWASNGQAFEGIDFHNWRGAPPGQRQLINRIKGNGGITNKDRLAINLRRHCKAAKLDPSSPLVPLSFIITPAGENELKADHELISFREAGAAFKKRGENMWIVKPALLNRGRGIQVFGSATKVEAFLRTKKPNNHWVVQKYIERPLLVGGRKFDIRLLVLATSDLGSRERQHYMYRDSYVRTSSIVYEPTGDRTADRCMHLVNDAVQSTFESYGTYEDSNKLSLPELQAIFDGQPLEESGKILSVQDDLWPAMKATVQQVFSCASQLFTPAPPGGGMFELFGLDFMIDASGKALLIEVNTQPALGRHGHVLQEMIPRMLEETIQKAVDPIFPPPADATPPELLDRFELVDIPSPPLVRLSSSTLSSTHAAEKQASPPRPSTAGLKRVAQSVMARERASETSAASASPTGQKPTEARAYEQSAEKRAVSRERATSGEPSSRDGSGSSSPQLEHDGARYRSLPADVFRAARNVVATTPEYLNARRRLDEYYDEDGDRLALEAALGPMGGGEHRPITPGTPPVSSKLPALSPRSVTSLKKDVRGRGSQRPLPTSGANRQVWMHVGDEFVMKNQVGGTGVWALHPKRGVQAQGPFGQGGMH